MLNELLKINERLEQLPDRFAARLFHEAKLQPVSNNTTVNQHISTTKIFNIDVFLNETCKDAINLESFVKNLVFELADKTSLNIKSSL